MEKIIISSIFLATSLFLMRFGDNEETESIGKFMFFTSIIVLGILFFTN